MIFPFNEKELRERLRRTKGFDFNQFSNGPKGIREFGQEVDEREMRYLIEEENGLAAMYRESVRWSVWFGPDLHFEELMRVRNHFIISSERRYYTGSGTRRKGEFSKRTVLRELLGIDSNEPAELPQLQALLEKKGVTLGPDDLDFNTLAHLNGIQKPHPSSVYWGGWQSVTNVINVVLDLAKFLDEPPLPNGTVAYDLGTYIPVAWKYYPQGTTYTKGNVGVAGRTIRDEYQVSGPVDPELAKLLGSVVKTDG